MEESCGRRDVLRNSRDHEQSRHGPKRSKSASRGTRSHVSRITSGHFGSKGSLGSPAEPRSHSASRGDLSRHDGTGSHGVSHAASQGASRGGGSQVGGRGSGGSGVGRGDRSRTNVGSPGGADSRPVSAVHREGHVVPKLVVDSDLEQESDPRQDPDYNTFPQNEIDDLARSNQVRTPAFPGGTGTGGLPSDGQFHDIKPNYTFGNDCSKEKRGGSRDKGSPGHRHEGRSGRHRGGIGDDRSGGRSGSPSRRHGSRGNSRQRSPALGGSGSRLRSPLGGSSGSHLRSPLGNSRDGRPSAGGHGSRSPSPKRGDRGSGHRDGGHHRDSRHERQRSSSSPHRGPSDRRSDKRSGSRERRDRGRKRSSSPKGDGRRSGSDGRERPDRYDRNGERRSRHSENRDFSDDAIGGSGSGAGAIENISSIYLQEAVMNLQCELQQMPPHLDVSLAYLTNGDYERGFSTVFERGNEATLKSVISLVVDHDRREYVAFGSAAGRRGSPCGRRDSNDSNPLDLRLLPKISSKMSGQQKGYLLHLLVHLLEKELQSYKQFPDLYDISSSKNNYLANYLMWLDFLLRKSSVNFDFAAQKKLQNSLLHLSSVSPEFNRVCSRIYSSLQGEGY